MGYEWDVFLSYKRHGEWAYWIRKHFLALLTHWLADELGDVPRVYWDEQTLEAGQDYPNALAHALSRSAVLLPLFSPLYVRSAWCKTEFGLMRGREQQCGYRTSTNMRVLIVGATINRGNFPDEIARVQAADLSDYASMRMAKYGPAATALENLIKTRVVPPVRDAILNAPAFDESWATMASDAMDEVFNLSQPRQLTVPGRIAA